VVAICRIGGRPIRPREPIGRPDGLIVQDPIVLQLDDLLEGLGPRGFLLINSPKGIEELGLGALVAGLQKERRLTIPATELGRRHIGHPIPDAALVGGFAALSGAVSLASVTDSIRGHFPGRIGDGDVAAAEAAFEYVEARIRELPSRNEPAMLSVSGRARRVGG
jgi:pyruvate ferredoxin oxidoreductase gamma subunit